MNHLGCAVKLLIDAFIDQTGTVSNNCYSATGDVTFSFRTLSHKSEKQQIQFFNLLDIRYLVCLVL